MPRGGNPRIYLTADAKGVERGTKEAEGYLGTLSHKGSDHFHKLAGSATGFALSLAGPAGVAFGIESVVDAAEKQQRSHAKLQAQLGALNISYKAHAKQIDEVIAKTTKLSGLDDEDLTDAFTNIVRVTGDVSKSLKLTGLAADFARAKHMDVAKAGELVGKVAGGNTGILSRYGISVKAVTTATDALSQAHGKVTIEQRRAATASDKLATAQAGIALLQNKFAGQAKAYGQTTEGAVDRSQVAFENLRETLGNNLAPTITDGANALADFINGMQDGTGAGGKFADEAKQIAGDLKPVLTTLEGIGKWVAAHPHVLELALGGAGLYKVGSKLIKPASLIGKAVSAAGGTPGLGAGVRPIPVYVVNGPGGGIPVPGKGGAPVVAPPGGIRGNPLVRGAGNIAGGLVVGAGISKIITDLIASATGNVPIQGLVQRAMGTNFSNGDEVMKAFKQRLHDLAASGDIDGIKKLADRLKELGDQTQDLGTRPKLDKLINQLDQVAARTKGANGAMRDAADANGALLQVQRRTTASAQDLAAKIRGIGQAGGDASDEMRRLGRMIEDLPTKARIDIIASVSETFRIGPRPGGTLQTTHRTDGTTFTSSPGAATGAFVAGNYSAGDRYRVNVAGEEVILNPEQQAMVGPGRIFAALHATGAPVIGAGGSFAGGALPAMVSAANSINRKHYSYLWGGGHNGSFSGPYDCSGAVSAVLHAGGVLDAPLVSGQFANWGDPGPGKVTLFANSDHVYMRIGNRYFGTSLSNPGGGAGWFPGAPRPGFAVRHVPDSLLGHLSRKGDGSDRGVKPGKTHHPQVTKGGTEGHIPGADLGIINGNAVPIPSFTADDTGSFDSSGGTVGGTDDGSQAQIDALNALNAQLQALNAQLAAQAADRQKLLNVSQAQYSQLFAGFVDAISGGIAGKVGLGYQTPSAPGLFARY